MRSLGVNQSLLKPSYVGKKREKSSGEGAVPRLTHENDASKTE